MKVVLFCGGLGTRLREYSETVPKPMVTIGYRPILWHLMKYYAHFGHTEFILCLGYRGDLIKQYFLELRRVPLERLRAVARAARTSSCTTATSRTGRSPSPTPGLHSNIGQRLQGGASATSDDDEIFLANYSRRALRPAAAATTSTTSARTTRSRASLCVRPSQSFHAVSLGARTAWCGTSATSSSVRHLDQRRLLRLQARDLRLHQGRRGPGRGALPAAHRARAADRVPLRRASGRAWTPSRTSKRFDDLNARGETPWQVWRSATGARCLGCASSTVAPSAAARALSGRALRRHRDRLRRHRPQRSPRARIRRPFTWVVFSSDATREAEALQQRRGASCAAPDSPDHHQEVPRRLPAVHGAAVKEAFEELKGKISPDLVLTHYRDDLHQDHRLISELTWNTFRDHLILEYEIPKYDGDLGRAERLRAARRARSAGGRSRRSLTNFRSQAGKRWFSEDLFRVPPPRCAAWSATRPATTPKPSTAGSSSSGREVRTGHTLSPWHPASASGVPVYNGEAFLRQTLDSLLAQTFRDFELIIADNASTDGTAAICQEYAGRDSRIRYVQKRGQYRRQSEFQPAGRAGAGTVLQARQRRRSLSPRASRAVCLGPRSPSRGRALLCADAAHRRDRGMSIRDYDDNLDLRS